MKSVAFLPANRDACALWRMFIPHLHTPNSKFILASGPLPIEHFVEADVCVVQRQASKGNIVAVELMHKLDKKVVYDLDDNMWQIPLYNPARAAIVPLKEGFEVCAQKCDVITVSTESLKKAVLQHMPFARNHRVEVVPNAIDLDYFGSRTRPVNDEKFVVGWGGSATHSKDIQDVVNLFPNLLKENPKLHVEMVGMEAGFGNSRLTYKRFAPVAEYASRLASWGWDLFLGPLEANTFNDSKSNIKILEAAAVGSPILVSEVSEYRDFMAHDPDLKKWLVCRTPNDWKRRIVTLMNEPLLRQELAGKMRIVVENYYDIRKVALRWQAIFESL